MARHIADKAYPAVPQRTARFIDQERRRMTRPNAAFRQPEDTPEEARLRAFLAQAAAGTEAAGRHPVDGPRGSSPARTAQFRDMALRDGLHPALAALHSRSRDMAEVARTRAFLRRARAEDPGSGAHAADGPRTPAPTRPARYVEMARAQGLHPSVRALRTRRSDATAMIRLREFLRIARGDTQG
ncbi:MAG: hypothetical protein ACXIUV_09350 [Alkalilacustris sp.]